MNARDELIDAMTESARRLGGWNEEEFVVAAWRRDRARAVDDVLAHPALLVTALVEAGLLSPAALEGTQ